MRLPSAAGYAAQVEKEQRWLPVLAPHLPLPVPTPVAQRALGYPHPWSVLRWIPGEPAASTRIDDLVGFATDLAAFLVALRGVDPAGGPPPGPHNFHRGGALTVYAEETLARSTCLRTVRSTRDGRTLAVWADAPGQHLGSRPV